METADAPNEKNGLLETARSPAHPAADRESQSPADPRGTFLLAVPSQDLTSLSPG